MTAYTRKVNCMFGKRASLAISGSVVHIHNMCRERYFCIIAMVQFLDNMKLIIFNIKINYF